MHAELLVSRSPGETRVALVEDGRLVEFDLERSHDRSVVGNVYRSRVTRVLPGMQAAFLDIGLERAAFLYVDDIALPTDVAEGDEVDDPEESTPAETARAARPPIQELLTPGQLLTVQVRKAPLSTKGARVTNYVTLPGRFVVYLPTMDRVGVSRKITDEGERDRLKHILESHRRPGEGGFIARTVCSGLAEATIVRDMDFVRSVWTEVEERAQSQDGPALLLEDLDLVLRTARDLFTEDIDRLVCDDGEEARRIRRLMLRHAPEIADRIEVAPHGTSAFDRHGVDRQLQRALDRTVQLPSGASLVFDEAEALTAIDINTGRYVGKDDLEKTILATNLEAAVEIATQIRLRNLGGIIVIDFIDMQTTEARREVYEAFCQAMERDRVKSHILPMTDFGLIELTRKRVRPSLTRRLTEACPYCEGRGRVMSRETVSQAILRSVLRTGQAHPTGTIVVSAMPDVAQALLDPVRRRIEAMEALLERSIVVEARSDLHQEVFQVTVRAGGGPAGLGP
jgi:ribonuclease G